MNSQVFPAIGVFGDVQSQGASVVFNVIGKETAFDAFDRLGLSMLPVHLPRIATDLPDAQMQFGVAGLLHRWRPR